MQGSKSWAGVSLRTSEISRRWGERFPETQDCLEQVSTVWIEGRPRNGGSQGDSGQITAGSLGGHLTILCSHKNVDHCFQ